VDAERTVSLTRADGFPDGVHLRVRPVDHLELNRPLAQVRLDAIDPLPSTADPTETPDEMGVLAEREEDLEEELRETKEQLRSTAEEHETLAEEMETANEELMSMNEELQAKNEELQTSKEQLRSVNEEMTSTNQELQDKVEALNRANNDLENLMAATDVGVLFLDREMQIRRFTDPITPVFRLRETDVGHPITDFTPRVSYPSLTADIQRVLDEHVSLEHEVPGQDRIWYLMRLRPYRTTGGTVKGVVLTFVDITAQKHAQTKIREERDFVSALIDTAGALIVVLDCDGSIVRFNTACEELTGVDASAATDHDVRSSASWSTSVIESDSASGRISTT